MGAIKKPAFGAGCFVKIGLGWRLFQSGARHRSGKRHHQPADRAAAFGAVSRRCSSRIGD
jgi:hypothetical protein